MREPGSAEEAAYIAALEERVRNQAVLKEIVTAILDAQKEGARQLAEMKSLATLIQQLPAEVGKVIVNADIVEMHRRLNENLQMENYITNEEFMVSQSKRLKGETDQVYRMIRQEIAQLRDAAAGKPRLPPAAPPGATLRRKFAVCAQRAAARLDRGCAAAKNVTVVSAALAVTFAALAVIVLAAGAGLHIVLTTSSL